MNTKEFSSPSGQKASTLAILILTVVSFALMPLLTSCNSNTADHAVEYLPFQENKGGNWGMIGTDGKVLFSEEFTSEPTVAVNGRFMVLNSNDMWEIYTTDEKPKKVGDEYVQAGLFYSNVAPVVEPGQPIKLIDRDGNVMVTLDKINGKAVSRCSNFINGQARVEVDGCWGVIDTDGDVIIEPKYAKLAENSQGYYIALDKKYADEKDYEKLTYTILDMKGKEVTSVKGSKIEDFRPVNTSDHTIGCIVQDAMIVEVRKDNKRAHGLMAFDGEWKMNPSTKLRRLIQNRGNNFVYHSGEGFGLIDVNGEEKIRDKYVLLSFLDNDILMARKSGDKDLILLSTDDEQIGKDGYMDIMPFYDGANAFAQVSQHDYVLINKKGEEQKLKADIYNIGKGRILPEFIESDFLDIDDLVGKLHIEKEGFLGLTPNLTGTDAIDKAYGMFGGVSKDAKKYYGTPFIVGKISIDKVITELTISTAGLIEQKVIGGGFLSYTDTRWTSNPVLSYGLNFDVEANSKLSGKMQDLYNKLLEVLSSKGKVLKKGKNAVVIDTGTPYSYYAGWAGKQTFLFYGKYNLSTCMTDEYDNASENELEFIQMPELMDVTTNAAEEEDYGELESPPADDL